MRNALRAASHGPWPSLGASSAGGAVILAVLAALALVMGCVEEWPTYPRRVFIACEPWCKVPPPVQVPPWAVFRTGSAPAFQTDEEEAWCRSQPPASWSWSATACWSDDCPSGSACAGGGCEFRCRSDADCPMVSYSYPDEGYRGFCILPARTDLPHGMGYCTYGGEVNVPDSLPCRGWRLP